MLMNIFNYIYTYNLWGFGSGSGSLSQNNKQYIDFLNQFIHRHTDIHRIIDLGCGDWQLHRHIDFKENEYVGIDIVKGVIDNNRRHYSTDKIRFKCLNFLDVDFILPSGDLLIVKDVLQHLSNSNIRIFLDKLRTNSYKYILITNDVSTINLNYLNIKDGMYKPFNIGKSPYNMKGTVVLRYYDKLYLIVYCIILFFLMYRIGQRPSRLNGILLVGYIFYGYFIVPIKEVYLIYP